MHLQAIGLFEGFLTHSTHEWTLSIMSVYMEIQHNEELNDLYSSTNIVRVIKWRRMRWAGHVACMGEERACIESGCGNRR